MRRYFGLATISILGSFVAVAQPAPEWQRAWTLSSIDCPHCQPEERAWLEVRKGQNVVFGPAGFVNPFYQDCPTGIDYSGIRQRSAAEARKFFGEGRLPPMATTLPLAGVVRCRLTSGPPNTVARVVIDGPDAFLLHESGAVLHLR